MQINPDDFGNYTMFHKTNQRSPKFLIKNSINSQRNQFNTRYSGHQNQIQE